MARIRTPWWAYVLIVTFVGFFALVTYLQFFPLTLGVGYENSGGKVISLNNGEPAASAGMRVGDRVVSYSGHPVNSTADRFGMMRSYQAGKPMSLEVERDGQRLTISPIPRRIFVAASGIDKTVVLFFYGRLALAFFLVSGIFLLLARPHDYLALALAISFLIGAAFAWPIPAGFTATFRSLPSPVQALLWIPLAVSCLLMNFLGCWFSLNFPRPLFSKRRIWALTIPWLLLGMVHLVWTYRYLYDPNVTTPFLFTVPSPGSRIEMAVLAIAESTFLIWNYLRLQDVNERRRVRLVLVAMLMLLGSAVAYAIPMLFFPNSVIARWMNSTLAVVILFSGFAAAPIICTYALIRHRIFDLRVMIRQGLRYAAARGVLIGIVPAAAIFVTADIALQGRQPLADILQKHGWVYAVVIALSVSAHLMRKQWMETLDRRFFRERYNVHQVLREVAEEIRAARHLNAAAPRTVARIEAALHSAFVALMVREAGRAVYCPQAISPSGIAVPELDAESKLIGAFRLFCKPLDTSSSHVDWLQQQLPHAETEFLRQAKIELMVPVSLADGSREAFLALGPKKSEEPYSSEDKELLLAIASSLALLLEQPAAAVSASSGLSECARCGTCYDAGVSACSQDGARLAPSSVPRLLVGRYRLDRKLGRGGMGTVYSAFDTSLERQVALKLIRDELVSSPEAADRFRREAKAAAAITHPNIVVSHDFAVDAGNRAFLIMELLPGITIRQRLQQRHPIPQEALLDILRGVCSALSVAHQRGIVHRDLKPENIFLVNDGGRDVPKVLDFGLAKFVASETDLASLVTVDTGAGVLVGTPQYMSPEQLNGGAVTASWDLWALAVVTYEIVAGAHPFANLTSLAALHNAILAGRFSPVPSEVPHAAKWQEFFTRSLHSDVAERPETAANFLGACERIFTPATAKPAASG